MRTVTIVGVGLIGGSFGLALRKRGFHGRILGVSSPASIEAAIRRGAIDRGEPLETACLTADLILLATPVNRILELLPRVLELCRAGALVTDAGSTKRAIVERAASSRTRGHFVGGHPMAGKELRGVEAADADLFAGRRWILCGPGRTDPVNELFAWVERAGAIPVLMTAEEHDRVISAASHLPQLLSTSLASLLAGRPDAAEIGENAGPGLASMTRLALSDAALWRDIVETNRADILARLEEFTGHLQTVRQAVQEGRIEELFASAAAFARRVRMGQDPPA